MTGVICLIFQLVKKLSIMSAKEPLLSCPNIGCRMTFMHSMQKKHHLEKKCMGTPPQATAGESMFRKEGDVFHCTGCKKKFKHANNITRHRKTCIKLKSKADYSNWLGNKKFQHKSKLTTRMKVHNRVSFACQKCGRDYKQEDHLHHHATTCTKVGIMPTMVDGSNMPLFVFTIDNLSAISDEHTGTVSVNLDDTVSNISNTVPIDLDTSCDHFNDVSVDNEISHQQISAQHLSV